MGARSALGLLRAGRESQKGGGKARKKRREKGKERKEKSPNERTQTNAQKAGQT